MTTYNNMFPGVVGSPALPYSSSWISRVLESRRFELNRFDSCIFAHKLKVGELPTYGPAQGSEAVLGRKSTFREYLLITLSHAEKRNLVPEEISLRLRELFVCLSIVISRETHDCSSFHFHVGLHSKNCSKNNCTKLIRNAFPEFSGSQCNVKFHKGWGTLIGYITKEDKSPYVWGMYSLSEILSIGASSRQKRKVGVKATEVVLDRLKVSDDWLEVYKSPEVQERLVYGSYANLKHVYEDLQVIKEIELSSFEKIDQYLKDREAGGVKIDEYSPEDIGEKYLLLDWIAVNLAFKRPIKTKQLHLYGPPSTQKTFILHSLKKVIRIYFASSRFNDFTGADDFYDLWVYDEFHQLDESGPYGCSDSSNAANNTLLKVLDGQECRLDAKYSRVFRKNKNVPIIIISNSITPKARRYGPFQARFMRLKFVTSICDLSEDRLIATLRGCILRRLGCASLPSKSDPPSSITLSYNSDRICLSLDSILNSSGCGSVTARTDKGEPVSLELVNSVLQETSSRFSSSYSYLRIKLCPSCLTDNFVSSLRFALVPLRKRLVSESSFSLSQVFPVFGSTRVGGNFRLLRSGSPDSMDYFCWPIRASLQDEKRVWSVEIVLWDRGEFSESLTRSPVPCPSKVPPFRSEDVMKRPGSFLQFTVGPVGDNVRRGFGSSSLEWDEDYWSDND